MNKAEKLAAVKDVAIYLRISDEKKTRGKRLSEEETFENHKARLTEVCKRNNYRFEIFQEIVSGGKTDIGERPELQKLLSRLTDFDAILVNEITRLSRDTFIAGLIQQKMVTFDKLILTPEHSYYLKDSNDALMYGINNVISAHERETIGKRIKFNKLEMARRGLNASGSVPIGYKRNPDTKRLEINEKTAHIPATAFYLNSMGWGALKIQSAFQQLGYRTNKGAHFTRTAIQDLLSKETYKGFTVYHDYEKRTILKDGVEVVKREIKETIKIPNTHDYIIAPEMFDRLSRQRTSRANKPVREREMKVNAPSIMKDLLFCSSCGRKKRITLDAKIDLWYIRNCNVKFSDANGHKCNDYGFAAKSLEQKVMSEVMKYKQKLESEIEMFLNDNQDSIVQDNAKMKSLFEKQMKELKETAEKLGEAYVDAAMKNNAIITAAFEKKIAENEAAQNNLQIKLNEINQKLNKPESEKEIKERLNVVEIINKIENETDTNKINKFLKSFILKIHYSRHIPEDLVKLGTLNPLREAVKPAIRIEFI